MLLLLVLLQQLNDDVPAREGPLPERPLLAPWLRRARVGGRLLLEYGDAVVALEGAAVQALLPRLLPLLDGTRPLGEVLGALGERARPAVRRALEALAGAGVVVDGPTSVSPAALLAAAASGIAPMTAAGRLSAARVAVAGHGRTALELLRVLAATGIRRADAAGWERAPAVDLAVAAPSPGELPELRGWNERLLATDTPWLQVLPYNGAYAALGPLVLPGDSACHECFRRRRAGTHDDADSLAALAGEPAPYPEPPALSVAIAGLAATLAAGWLATADPSLPGALFVLELDAGVRITRHTILRVPRCPACSPAERVAPPLPWTEEAA